MSKTLAKKAFAVASSSALIVATFAGFAAHAAVHAAGTNVISNGTVYFIDPSGVRRGYTSEGAFLSYGFNSWSKVVPASAEDLALPVSSAYIPPMDGALVLDSGTIYLIVNGQRAGFTSMTAFSGLGYKLSNVVKGDTSFMSAAAIVSSATQQHPVGTLINQNGTVYLVGPNGTMGIPSQSVFNSWGYSWNWVVPANSADAALPMSAGVMPAYTMGSLSPFHPYTGGTTPIPPVNGNVSVSASSDMPASRPVVSTEGLADLAHFTFSGNGTVTQVNLKRLGVSADTSLSNVFLFDGGTRLTDAASVTTGGMINFSNANGLFTVNGSKTIAVKADMAATAGETIGIQLVSALTGSTSVAGTPVNGNLMTIATATLAGVALGTGTGSGNTDPGTGINVWQSTATVTTRDVLMTRLALRQTGSIQSSDINNFTLYVDGTQVATASNLDANGYVTFNLSKALTTGARVLKVTADVIGGSGRSVQLSLRGAYDISLTDTQYNAGVKATGTFPVGPSSFTVNSGTMTVVKASDSQSANLTVGASDQQLGKFTFTAFGEPIKVESLDVGMITNGTPANVTIRNVRILVNGAQVGSTTNVPAAASFAGTDGTTFTTNFVVNPGSPATVEVRGDMYDTEGTNDITSGGSTTTVQAVLVGSANENNAVPQVSLGTLDVPASNVSGNTLTIASGSVSIAKTATYGNQTVVAPQTAYKIGSFQVSGNSTEAVNLNTIYVGFSAGDTATESTDLSNLYIVYGGTMSSVKGSVTESANPATANSWSVNKTLAVNETMTVDVYATIASSLSTNTIIPTLAVAGTTALSGVSVYGDSNSSNSTLDATGFTGQTITGGSGSITATADASTPVSAIVDDNQTVTSAAYKFAAVNDAYTITDVTLTIADATNVQSVNLKDGSTVVATKPGATTVTFNGLNIAAGSNTNKVLTVDLVLGTVGVGAGSSGASILTTLTAATARNSSGTSAAVTESDPAGNVMYVYHAIPTVTNVALPTGTLVAGTNTIYKFTVGSNGSGTISWNKIIFTVTASTNPTIANGTSSTSLWDADTNTQVGGTSTAAGLSAGGATGTVTFVATNEQQVSGSKTYFLKATVGGTLATGDTLQTSIAQPSSFAAPNTYATVAGTTASFVWSDQSASAHSTSTSDWNNGFLVKNLPTDSQTLTK